MVQLKTSTNGLEILSSLEPIFEQKENEWIKKSSRYKQMLR